MPVSMFVPPLESRISEFEALRRVVESGRYILGREVDNFERSFAEYIGVAACIGVANGTDALELALRALGISQGSQVLLSANAGFYGSAAVRSLGAVPRYCDVDDRTLCLSRAIVEREIETARPDAIIVTHLYGQMADMEGIVEVARAAEVPVVEDCAQAHGASRGGRRAGSWGTISCFSFYPTKNLGALGDGGAVLTNDETLAGDVRALHQYGWSAKYTVSVGGGRNSRLDELQAAILNLRLPKLDAANDERRKIAKHYNKVLGGLPVRMPTSISADFVGHLYVLRCEQRNELRSFLRDRGIATEVHYPVADHLQPAYLTVTTERLPVTEESCTQVLSLPCYPGMSEEAVTEVVDGVREFFERKSR